MLPSSIIGLSLLAERNSFSQSCESAESTSFSFCISCSYSFAASSAPPGCVSINAAASDVPAGFSSPPAPAEHAARPIASRDAANTAEIFNSFAFMLLIFLISIPPFFNRYPSFEPYPHPRRDDCTARTCRSDS